MSIFQKCHNTSDVVPLYLPQQLYLKPIARLNISLQLPNLMKQGKSVSHWEIMDKLRDIIRPEEFSVLKVTKTTVEFVRFEAELETRAKLGKIIDKLDNKMIKLKDFSDLMRIKASEYKSDFPTKRVWDPFFAEAKDMDEMKPGERPDTVHISNLPTKWFVPYHLSNEEDVNPSEKILYRIFEKFGSIRNVDIPICDPYRKKMKDQISGLKCTSFDKKDIFEGYVQFKDYIGFSKAMDALRDMKLVHREDDENTEVNIKVDFDRSKHLSDASIRRREIVRDRLVKKAREKEEKEKRELEEKKRKEEAERQREVDVKAQKEMRRRLREEKRKARILKKLEISGSDEINEKIAREEKKLLKVQRKLEAIRLVEELFRRVGEKHRGNVQLYDGLPDPARDELKRYKNSSELDFLTQREKLHHAIKGRAVLRTILSDEKKKSNHSSSSESDSTIKDNGEIGLAPGLGRPNQMIHPAELMHDDPTAWYYGFNDMYYQNHMYPDFQHMRGMYHPRGRGMMPRPPMTHMPGPSRGMPYMRRQRRRRGAFRGRSRYPPELEDEYRRYFEKFLHEHDDRERRSKSYSPKRSSRRDRSHRHSYSRSRSRSRDRRSRSRSHRSRSRSRSYSRSRSRSYSRSHSKDKKSSRRSRTPRRRDSDRRRSRSRSKSKSKSSMKERSYTPAKKRDKSRTKSREKSVDSSQFISPKTLQQMSARKSRSRSWSMPKEGEPKERSWSKSPEKNKE